jgi:thymidylate synthase (FAD)
MKCVKSEEEPHTSVCLIAENVPLGGGEPSRLPILGIKVSTGGVLRHGGVEGVKYYLTREWKEGWTNWLKHAEEGFPSVLEHAVFTFYIDGCSRVCSHQLVRHRLISFTQESQRYTEERIRKAFERSFKKLDDETFWSVLEELMNLFSSDVDDFEKRLMLKDVEERGVPVDNCRERAKKFLLSIFVVPPPLKSEDGFVFRSYASSLADYAACRKVGGKMEDCRFLLPQAVRTSLLATANLREWLHVIELRAHPKAQWEIRGVARAIKKLLKEELPWLE